MNSPSHESTAVMTYVEPGTRTTEDRRSSGGVVAVIASCFSALMSAATCAVLLLVNGSITYVLLESFGSPGGSGMTGEGVTQFLLFTAPVALLVIEWLMWDLAVNILTRSWSETD